MPELTSLEHLQPCLLDRLTDDVPGSAQESRAQRVVSHQRYRQGVLRDLEWLLNTGAPLPEDGRFKLRDFPEAQKSVLNYGMRHIAGLTAPNMDVLCREMMEVIRVFEPRIDPATLSVAASMERNMIFFEIRGELWARPMPEQLFLKTQMDLEVGLCVIGDRAHG